MRQRGVKAVLPPNHQGQIKDLTSAYLDDNLNGWGRCPKLRLAGRRKPAEMFLAFKVIVGVQQTRSLEHRGSCECSTEGADA